MQNKFALYICTCTYGAHVNEPCSLCVEYREKDCVPLVCFVLFLLNLYYRFAFLSHCRYGVLNWRQATASI